MELELRDQAEATSHERPLGGLLQLQLPCLRQRRGWRRIQKRSLQASERLIAAI